MGMMPIPELSEPSSANMCGIGRADISTTDLSRTIAASRIDVDRCLDWRALYQRHATAVAMTNCETFCDADPECANMFPPQCGAGDICGKPRLSSLSWRQLECWRRWSKLAELSGAKTDRTFCQLGTRLGTSFGGSHTAWTQSGGVAGAFGLSCRSRPEAAVAGSRGPNSRIRPNVPAVAHSPTILAHAPWPAPDSVTARILLVSSTL